MNFKERLFFIAVKNDNIDDAKRFVSQFDLDVKSIRDKKGNSAAHLVKSCEMLDFVKELGCDVNQQNYDGDTPLAVVNDEDLIFGLLVYRANPNIQNNKLETPLIKYSKMVNDENSNLKFYNFIGIATYLRNFGADATIKDRQNKDACYYLNAKDEKQKKFKAKMNSWKLSDKCKPQNKNREIQKSLDGKI